jgi:hypothetical protein
VSIPARMYGFWKVSSMRGVMSIPHMVKNLFNYTNIMWAKEYNVGTTRVGLQKIKPKRERDNSNSTSTIQRLQVLSKSIKEKKCQRKDHFLQSLHNQNALLHAFARLFAETTMVKVGGGGGGGVDITVDDNGVLTLGESLFACVARSLVCVLACLFGWLCAFRSLVLFFLAFFEVQVQILGVVIGRLVVERVQPKTTHPVSLQSLQ